MAGADRRVAALGGGAGRGAAGRPARSRLVAPVVAMLVVAGACTAAQPGPAPEPTVNPQVTVGADGILQLRDDPTAPYVITAIDYHFHDAHPTQPLSTGRTVVVSNVGRNTHNVSIPGTSFSADVKPGDRLRIPEIGEVLDGAGSHAFVCSYHANLGMRGRLVIASG
jgi:hypothetical protein